MLSFFTFHFGRFDLRLEMDRLFRDRRAGRLEERLGEALHAVDAHERGRLARLGGKVALVELRVTIEMNSLRSREVVRESGGKSTDGLGMISRGGVSGNAWV